MAVIISAASGWLDALVETTDARAGRGRCENATQMGRAAGTMFYRDTS